MKLAEEIANLISQLHYVGCKVWYVEDDVKYETNYKCRCSGIKSDIRDIQQILDQHGIEQKKLVNECLELCAKSEEWEGVNNKVVWVEFNPEVYSKLEANLKKLREAM